MTLAQAVLLAYFVVRLVVALRRIVQDDAGPVVRAVAASLAVGLYLGLSALVAHL